MHRNLYRELGSDTFAMISLFQYDQVFTCDPACIVEMKVTGTDRFQIDLLQVSKVLTTSYFVDVDFDLWT